MNNPILFVSLGPGDAEMITLKACNALRQADVILLPATRRADGSLTSRANDVVRTAMAITEKPERTDGPEQPQICLYPLPMKTDRRAAHAVYDEMKADALRWQCEGRRVVIGVEGDISIYASVHYLLDSMADEGVDVEQVAGIPSFIASAAAARQSLISGSERLLVVPGNVEATELEQLLASGHVVVVMKLSQCEAAVKAFMHANPHRQYHYFENTGMPQALYLTDVEQIAAHHFPYFSQLIIK